MNTQKPPSLRTRYISLTLILATLVIGFVSYTYSQLSKQNSIVTNELTLLEQQLNVVNSIRKNITNIYRSFDLFLLNPKDKENIEDINSDLNNIIDIIINTDFEIIGTNSTQPIKDTLLKNFSYLQTYLNQLIEIRSDPNLQYPGMSISANIMSIQQNIMKSKLIDLQLEIENHEFEPESKDIYSEIFKARILVEKEISQARIYIANRLALFSDDILLNQANSLTDIHKLLVIKLNKLKKLYKNEESSFEGYDIINLILKNQMEWYQNFGRLRENSESDNWQQDSRLMKEKILPLIKDSTVLLQHYNKQLEKNKKQTVEIFKSNNQNLFYILSVIIAIFLVFISVLLISLDIMVFKPISNIAIVMKLKAFGKSEKQFSKQHSKETQSIVNAFDELDKKILQKSIELRNTAQSAAIAENEARQANAAKSKFLANMSHELRTPLHGIISFSELGSSSKKVTPEKSSQYFDAIHQSGQRLYILLNDLLDLVSLETGKLEVTMNTHDLYSSSINVINQLQADATNKNISININCDKNSLQAEFDDERIIQVISNLLSNAIKFTPDNGQIDIYLEEISLSTSSFAQFTIKDTGMGIPDEELKTIFDKFTESTLTQSKAGGTGLGLAICSEIIHLHHGTIYAEKNNGIGACFVFLIPIKQGNKT